MWQHFGVCNNNDNKVLKKKFLNDGTSLCLNRVNTKKELGLKISVLLKCIELMKENYGVSNTQFQKFLKIIL